MSGGPFSGVGENQFGSGAKDLCAVTRASSSVIASIHPTVAEGNGLHVVASGDIKLARIETSEIATDHFGAVHLASPLAGGRGRKRCPKNVRPLVCRLVSAKLWDRLVVIPLGNCRWGHSKEPGEASIVGVQRFSGLPFSDVHARSLVYYTDMSSTLNNFIVKLAK